MTDISRHVKKHVVYSKEGDAPLKLISDLKKYEYIRIYSGSKGKFLRKLRLNKIYSMLIKKNVNCAMDLLPLA